MFKARKRILKIMIVIFCVPFVLIGKLYYLQFVKGDFLKEKAELQQNSERYIVAARGTIYDTTGKNILAKSYSVQTTNQNMVAGSSYEYTLEFNANNVSEDSLYPIEFTVTEVTGWGNFTNVTIP